MFVRLIKLVVVGWIVGMIAGSLAALSMKRRLVPTTDESADEIVAVAIFAPLAFHSTATAFRGGALECWYGGGVLDLRDAVARPRGRDAPGSGDLRWRPDPRAARLARGHPRARHGRDRRHPSGERLQGRRAGAGHRGHGDRRRVRRDVRARRGEAEWLAGMKGKTGGNGATEISPAASDDRMRRTRRIPRPRSWHPPPDRGAGRDRRPRALAVRLRLVGPRVLVAQAIDVGPARFVGGRAGLFVLERSFGGPPFVQDHAE